jgi:hypothetical protein
VSAAPRSGRAITAAQAAIFTLAFLVLAGFTLAWPMTYDDLHLIRTFSAREIARAFADTYDPDNMEVGGYRPLTVVFNHLRHVALGENVIAHRLFLIALYAAFLAGLGTVARALGGGFLEGVLGGLLALLSRYSVYHYAFLTDGAHVVQGAFFLAALAGLWAWVRGGPVAALGGSLAAVAGGLMFREDTLGAVPALWLLAGARFRDEPRVWRRLAVHAAACAAIVVALLAIRQAVVPSSPQPAIHIGGWLDYVVRTSSLAGHESFDGLSRWAVLSWRLAPALFLGALLLCDPGSRLRALVWAACAASACSPALTLRREDLLFFPVSFAGLAYAAALVGAARRYRLLAAPVAALVAWLAAAEAYVTRDFLLVFHPMSSTSLTWSGAFVYGYYGDSTVPPARRQQVVDRLAAIGIRSSRDYFEKLPRKIYNLEQEGQRLPAADGRPFVPRLQFRAFKP